MIPDRIERRMRPARLGMIGLGVRVDDHAKEVEYFVVGDEIAKVYDDKPTRLPVRFPWPEPEQVLHSISYVLRKGRSVVGRCDGRQFIEIQADGKDRVHPCKLPPDDDYAQCPLKCRASARLDVVVAKTPFGIWQVRVGGVGRIADILGQLRLYRAAVGPLTQFPFEIERVEVQEQYFKATGEVAWRKGYPIRVRSPYTVEQVAAIQEARGLPVALPPAPHEEDILDEDETNGTSPEPTREPDREMTHNDPTGAKDRSAEHSRTDERVFPVARGEESRRLRADIGQRQDAISGPVVDDHDAGSGTGTGSSVPESRVREPSAPRSSVAQREHPSRPFPSSCQRGEDPLSQRSFASGQEESISKPGTSPVPHMRSRESGATPPPDALAREAPPEKLPHEPLADLVDVSRCYQWAAGCGMTPELYERYFEAHHGVRTSDAPDALVAREADEFRALEGESARLAHKGTIIKRLNDALKAKGGKRA